jgi:L-asparaginase / beta-aspartyl-peptidase
MSRKRYPSILLVPLVLVLFTFSVTCQAEDKVVPVLVIHAGAGVEKLTATQEKAYHEGLADALKSGYRVLQNGGQAIDAVEAAIKCMEDARCFNAGCGAVLNHEGKAELDAAIMDGKTRSAGAVADVTGVKNPIDLALAVMRRSGNVLLVGEGANRFARESGLEMKPAEYFFNKNRWQALQEKLESERKKTSPKSMIEGHKFGTVGAVALDQYGNLAAGTSTGGLTGKRWGRVGDSPIIGAGTFADNASCAVSCTGEGEWFIRFNVASDLAARYKYEKKSVATAADEIIHGVLSKEHGEGGLIVLDRQGNYAMPFNSDGMLRGYIGADGQPHTFIY